MQANTKGKAKRQRSQGKVIRWSLGEACLVFGLSPKTVAQRVNAAGVVAGEDGLFTPAEVHAAVCGDYERERTRKLKEEADMAALENARARGEVLDKQDFLRRWEAVFVQLKQLILGCSMSDAEKDALLKKMAAELHQS